MRTKLAILAVAASITLVLASACSSSTTATPADYVGSCDVLATRCHAAATALAKECHDLGHTGDDAKCGPRRAECLTECPEASSEDSGKPDADSPIGDGSTDAADAAPDPACVSLCSCVEATCADQSNYPYGDPGSCLAACALFSAAERSCFQSFCEKAADGGTKAHDCDHATGKLGGQECP